MTSRACGLTSQAGGPWVLLGGPQFMVWSSRSSPPLNVWGEILKTCWLSCFALMHFSWKTSLWMSETRHHRARVAFTDPVSHWTWLVGAAALRTPPSAFTPRSSPHRQARHNKTCHFRYEANSTIKSRFWWRVQRFAVIRSTCSLGPDFFYYYVWLFSRGYMYSVKIWPLVTWKYYGRKEIYLNGCEIRQVWFKYIE